MDHRSRPTYLVSALGARTKRRFTDLLAPIDLQPAHYGALHWIEHADGSSQQEVADLMHVGRSVMVGLVDDLEGAALVTRGQHPADRRAHALHLTAAGRRTLQRADRLADSLDADLLDALPAADRAPFVAALRRIATATGLDCGAFTDEPVAAGPPLPHPSKGF